RSVLSVAEAIDQETGSEWNSHIVNDISRCLAAHFDQGQAVWASPWNSDPLFAAWRQMSQHSRRMEMLGIPGFRKFMATLSPVPQRAIEQCLQSLQVPQDQWREFLLATLLTVSGWAAYVRYRGWKPGSTSELNLELVGLLALRLTYDTALANTTAPAWRFKSHQLSVPDDVETKAPSHPTHEVLARYCVQIASEIAYRRQLLQNIQHAPQIRDPQQSNKRTRKAVQMVFCIDVRSELYRRHLESLDPSIETFGFAGFFGMPLRVVPLGVDSGTAHCPVLLTPSIEVREAVVGPTCGNGLRAVQQRLVLRSSRKLWKTLQSSAVSCFAFVESIGLSYGWKLASDSLRLTRPVGNAATDGISPGQPPELGLPSHIEEQAMLTRPQQATLAENMLRNLGLTESFAPLVVLCGHESEVVNTPYKSGLDCGACGGHSGEPNARFAAQLLNDLEIRNILATRGITIPEDTLFVAAVHITTTDEIRLPDCHQFGPSWSTAIQELQHWLLEASRLSRLERADRFGDTTEADLLRRSRDWAEVRPEWGLAGNAAFIVAPRERTCGMNLSGRVFMHSYDHQRDPEYRILELIMTAPMVVTSWINLQYYASSVDNRNHGSGNKLIHNVVGQLGVLEGNGGDLRTGLPWQSVHDGQDYQHEPLRLLVLIEAPASAVECILRKHAHLNHLATKGWISVVV
ncbi:MAG: DUF2309 domain-containing protein, partial [Planctomycetaceae bacterium]|nr:DUF2309 domain-containing protein [Planctomycetaceae bacterium]